MIVPRCAEDFTYEPDRGIFLPGLHETSCFCLQSAGGNVDIGRLLRQRLIRLR